MSPFPLKGEYYSIPVQAGNRYFEWTLGLHRYPSERVYLWGRELTRKPFTWEAHYEDEGGYNGHSWLVESNDGSMWPNHYGGGNQLIFCRSKPNIAAD